MFSFLLILLAADLAGQKTVAFFGSFNWEKDSAGIYGFELDTTSGKLSEIFRTNGVRNPSFLTVSPNGKYIYACTDSKTPNAGSVSAFEFNHHRGKLVFLNSRIIGAQNPVYVDVSPDSKWLINATYTDAGVFVFPLDEKGLIGPRRQVFRFLEGSYVHERQDYAHIHAAIFGTRGNYFAAPDLGGDRIRMFGFNSELEKPAIELDEFSVQTDSGSGPRHVVFAPKSPFVYCVTEMAGTVEVFRCVEGKLQFVERVATHEADTSIVPESSDIHISPDNKFLYVSNRGQENNIAIFSINQNGTLNKVGYQSTIGNHPRVFALDPSGKFLIVGNVNSGNVVVFRRNPATGLLTQAGEEIYIRNVSCVQIHQY